MGEQPTTPKQQDRKLTYRVGWKSGTIHAADRGARAPASRPAASGSTGVPASDSLLRRTAALLFAPAPLPPLRAWRYILPGLPFVAFGVSWWLIYMLSSFD